jgi:hypothetical protein
MGERFLGFMSEAITGEWAALTAGDPDALTRVQEYVERYVVTVYAGVVAPDLAAHFAEGRNLAGIRSGEFDALSYAFYRDAFETLAARVEAPDALALERRLFTRRVGERFFDQLADELTLDLPAGLESGEDFNRLKDAIDQVGAFLQRDGYLRDHFAFRFDVHLAHAGRAIEQSEADVLVRLHADGLVYALYEMGYPVILPSAVYLYHTLGEAQHHSSRTIEELFRRMGYAASETDDFDPTGYPSHLVVELWEIRASV